MKNFLILLMAAGFALPVNAVCPVTGFCAPESSALSSPNLTEKYMPNNLNEMQKPDAFMPQYRPPYYDMLIHTSDDRQNTTPGLDNNNTESTYNSNCQFGLCIPSTGVSEE